ncbi:MAG TPA: hypothetical protein VG270_10290 [Pseudolabrys sp.]|jgi:hypothetical protein|nr:hypothetical protein [Pseudolabrys sp.]
MNPYHVVRMIAVLSGAAVLFALVQWRGVGLYLAIPAAIAIYAILLVGLGLAFKVEPPRRK